MQKAEEKNQWMADTNMKRIGNQWKGFWSVMGTKNEAGAAFSR
jgi:hypothetical protein